MSSGNEGTKDEVQTDIGDRLEKLYHWQESQKKFLNERQNKQRKMLGLDHKNLYQVVDLVYSDQSIATQNNITHGKDGDQKLADMLRRKNCPELQTQLDSSTANSREESSLNVSLTASQLRSDNNLLGLREETTLPATRKFLKRGEGLKQRFKMDPNALRLSNLPKYKYANAHAHLNKPKYKKNAPVVSPKRKPNSEKPSNCRPVKPLLLTNPLDAKEKRFQHLLLSSSNTLSSTPDSKTFASLPNISHSSPSKMHQNIRLASCENFINNTTSEISDIPVTWAKVLDSQQISPLPVHEIRLQKRPTPVHDDNESLSIFEMLEQKAKQGNIDLESSSIKKIIERRAQERQRQAEDYADIIPVEPRLRERGLTPEVDQLNNLNDDNDSQGNEAANQLRRVTIEDMSSQSQQSSNHSSPTLPSVRTIAQQKPQLRVRFSDENIEFPDYPVQGDSMNSSVDVEETTISDSTEVFNTFKNALFSALRDAEQRVLGKSDANGSSMEAPTTANGSSIDETMPSCSKSPLNSSPKSPPKLLPNSPRKSPEPLETNPPVTQQVLLSYAPHDLQSKTALVKVRLDELEKEIATFKEHNRQLIEAKQQHELEKAHFVEKTMEALDRMNDEKIQNEIYLHDERMKLQNEKLHHEQQMKTQNTSVTSKLRKEITSLKQQVEELQTQLKQKDQTHTAAQARLRTQIRQLERDKKHLLEDIERLTKENKKLEMQNSLLQRDQHNNKMLQEINRNLAKLTPKLAVNNTEKKTSQLTVTKSTTSRRTLKSRATKEIGRHSAGSSHDQEIPKNKKKPPRSPSPEASSSSSSSDQDNLSNVTRKSATRNAPIACSHSEGEETLSDIRQSHSRENQENDKSKANIRNEVGANISTEEFKREIVHPDGSKDIMYPNGNIKKISSDGMIIRMLYFNKDIKETNINEGTVKYYYAATNTWHTTYLDGLEILEFPNGQTEHRHKNGTVEVHFPDNSIKIIDPNDKFKKEEWRFANGSNLIQMRNGDKIIVLPNGQKEVHTSSSKRREYPDGTVKIVYPDGSQETRYSNGRVRLKDKHGNLVMDSQNI